MYICAVKTALANSVGQYFNMIKVLMLAIEIKLSYHNNRNTVVIEALQNLAKHYYNKCAIQVNLGTFVINIRTTCCQHSDIFTCQLVSLLLLFINS